MIVYWIAAAQALLYLGAVPMHAALYLCGAEDPAAGTGLRFGVGVSAFEGRFALRRAMKKAERSRLPRRRKKPRAKKTAAIRLLWPMARRLKLRELSLQGWVSLGDAAATALVCGAAGALDSALRGVAPLARVRLTPDFASETPRLELRGIIAARSGQIMLAAARGGLHYAKERTAQWISTRLKA